MGQHSFLPKYWIWHEVCECIYHSHNVLELISAHSNIGILKYNTAVHKLLSKHKAIIILFNL